MDRYYIESLIFKKPLGFYSRGKGLLYRLLGMSIGKKNRFELGKSRRLNQIRIGDNNTFTSNFALWPEDSLFNDYRITIGDGNYFNRNVMLDACGSIEIGNFNMFGPDVYITDSNHSFGPGISPKNAAMVRGKVKIGNECWIGAKAIILKDVTLGDRCVVAAGAVVTKSFPEGSLIGGVPAKLIK